MKNLYYLLFLSMVTLSCGDDDISLLTMEYRGDFSLNAGLDPFQTHFFDIYNIPTNKAVLFDAAGLTDDNVEMIVPRTARLSSIFDGPTFDFAEEVFIRIYTTDRDDYLEVFWRQPVPENTGGDLDLIAGLGDAKEYFTEPTFNITIGFKNLRFITPQSIDGRVELSFDAK